MPNEMNHADLADRLEKERSYQSAAYHTMGADGLDNGWFDILRQAAANERRIASRELIPAPVKCGECKYCHTNSYSGVLFCDARPNVNSVNRDDFCSYGERKDGEPHA